MNSAKRKRLESKGFKVGSVQEFLDLSPEESKIIELKITLGRKLQAYRKAKRLTQIEFARKIKSSQSRVAKMESGDPSVSIDLMVRSFFRARSLTKTAFQNCRLNFPYSLRDV